MYILAISPIMQQSFSEMAVKSMSRDLENFILSFSPK